MAELPSVEACLEGRDQALVRLFRRFEQLVERCGRSEVRHRSSIVYWARKRIFAGAYIQRGYLELNVDLLREAEHPCLIAAFHTAKRAITHRLRVSEASQLDDALAALVSEALPGRRPRDARLTSLH